MKEILFVTHAHWVAAVAQSAVSVAWESLLLVGCVALCLRLLPGISAAARSVVWIVVLLLLAILPFLNITGSTSVGNSGRLEIDMKWAWLLAAVWAVFAVARLVQLLHSAWHVARVSAEATSITSEQLEALGLDDIKMPHFRRVRLCTSLQVDVPCVAGFFRPCVLLPPALLHSLSKIDLKQIVQHELEHLRRRDDWVNLLQKCSLVVMPLNPGLWWVERRLCVERELACDDGVLEHTGAPKAYAVCLANLAEKSLVRRNASLVLGAWRRRGELTKRIYRILRTPTNPWGRFATTTSLSVLLVSVGVGAIALGHMGRLISFSSSVSLRTPKMSLSASSIVPSSQVLRMPVAAVPRPFLVSEIMHRRRKLTKHLEQAKDTTPSSLSMAVKYSHGVKTEDAAETLVVWRKSAKHSLRHTITAEDSHFTYAAIPIPYGWLIVQL